eukprot:scaffold58995_cov58-Phaeocystis_antarctica.AAC.4
MAGTSRALLVRRHTALQALQREYPVLCRASAGALDHVMVSRKQLVVEAADRCELSRGLCWVRDDLQDVALQRQDKKPASLQVGVLRVLVLVVVVVSLDEVEAVLRNAKVLGRPPLTRH